MHLPLHGNGLTRSRRLGEAVSACVRPVVAARRMRIPVWKLRGGARLISELIKRATSKTDNATAYRLRINFHIIKSEYREAVGNALKCLRLFGIEIPEQPTWEQVHDEYEEVWRNLGAVSIETLVDLPSMTDPEIQAATGVLSSLYEVAF